LTTHSPRKIQLDDHTGASYRSGQLETLVATGKRKTRRKKHENE